MTSSPLATETVLPDHASSAGAADVASAELLASAWQRHRVYSGNAKQAQELFFAVERLILILAIVVVVLAVAQPIVVNRIILTAGPETFRHRLPLSLLVDEPRYILLGVLNLVLIVVPIAITVLRAFAIRFSRGNSWVLLRGSAEALKMEIFYFRTQVNNYRTNRNLELATRLQLISKRLEGSVVQQRALSPYENQPAIDLHRGIFLRLGRALSTWANQLIHSLWDVCFGVREEPKNPAKDRDDRTSDLTPDRYIKYRLEEQFDWYRSKARGYYRQHQLLQSGVYIFGGLGTLLAAIGFQGWVAVTAAFAAALVNYLEYRRVEATLMGYNQAADTLYDIRTWWLSLSEPERADFTNFEKLVVNTEETIRSEHNSWLQDMQDRLANLYDADQKDQAPEAVIVALAPEIQGVAPQPAPPTPKPAPLTGLGSDSAVASASESESESDASDETNLT